MSSRIEKERNRVRIEQHNLAQDGPIMPPPSRDFIRGIEPDQDNTCILSTLQGIASHESVTGVAVRCLDLLNNDNEDVRNWAAECLSGSVRPIDEEAPTVIEFMEETVKKCHGSETAEVRRRFNDQLYWAATLIGRLGVDGSTDPASLRRVLDEVIELPTRITADEKEAYAPAIKRAERILQRFG